MVMPGCINFLAAIALLLYGINLLRRGSERVFGAQLRRLMQTATSNNFRGLVAGFVLSIFAPSSTAVALLTVESVNAGYVTSQQVLAVMLGANIGFTLTVQLLAFKFYLVNPIFIIVGAGLYLFGRRDLVRGAGQVFFGIGFLLLSIQMLSAAVAPLKSSAEVRNVIQIIEAHPVWLVAFAALLKLMLQSATATIGVALALCAEGVLNTAGGVAVVIGTNIGIGVTALLAGFARIESRRMAVGNLICKLAGAAACAGFILPLTTWLLAISPAGPAQAVANAHSLFNIGVALVFLPLVPVVGKLVERMIPSRAEKDAPFGPMYLDKAALGVPAMALAQASREVLRMADLVQAMLREGYRAFAERDEALCSTVEKEDDKIDLLDTEIKAYLIKLSAQALTANESKRELALLAFTNDLETIGDIVERDLMGLAKKKITLKVEFSKDGAAELTGMVKFVTESFQIALGAFTTQDRVLAAQLVHRDRELSELEHNLRSRHFERLRAGLQESVETSAIHLDILTYLKAIHSHLTAVAYPILENQPT
jgi:phosphate:Na+ symporter